MFTKRALGLFLIITVLITGTAEAQEPFRLSQYARFSFGMDWGSLWLWGETLVPAGGQPGSGTKLDAFTELGIDQNDATGLFFTSEIFNNHLFNLDFLAYSPTGKRILNKTVKFQNRTYEQGTVIDTKVDFNWSRFNYTYKAFDSGQFWFGPRFGVNYVLNTTTINGLSLEEGVISNTRSLDGTYPVLGFEARYLLPYGLEFAFETEGIHLITRGYLEMTKLSAKWDFHPEVAFTLSGTFRTVQYVEDHQPLNNEWQYSSLGWSLGIAFSF